MRISDWSSDVCSSDLRATRIRSNRLSAPAAKFKAPDTPPASSLGPEKPGILAGLWSGRRVISHVDLPQRLAPCPGYHATSWDSRSEEHTSELQSLMRISYAVFCLKKKKKTQIIKYN